MGIDNYIDKIFNKIDNLLRDNKFDEIDLILDHIEVDKYPIVILIAYLCITNPFIQEWHIKSTGHISESRKKFFFRVLEKLKKDGESEVRIDRLLNGQGLKYYSKED